MNKIVNVIKAKSLAKRYETISLEEIKDTFNHFEGLGMSNSDFKLKLIKQSLTGFGTMSTCTLCQATNADFFMLADCFKCIYFFDYKNGKFEFISTIPAHQLAFCNKENSTKSYDDIYDANTPIKLKNAYRRRAIYLRNLIKRYEDSRQNTQ